MFLTTQPPAGAFGLGRTKTNAPVGKEVATVSPAGRTRRGSGARWSGQCLELNGVPAAGRVVPTGRALTATACLIYPLTVVLVSPDGVRVEQVVLQRHLDRPRRTFLRVERSGYLLRDCTAVREVAELVDLGP